MMSIIKNLDLFRQKQIYLSVKDLFAVALRRRAAVFGVLGAARRGRACAAAPTQSLIPSCSLVISLAIIPCLVWLAGTLTDC